MKKVLYIGAGLIIGSAVTVYLLNKKKEEHDVCPKYKEPEPPPVADAPLAKIVPNQKEHVYENVKSSAIENLYSRHGDTATIIRDSVEVIRENVKVSENTNNEINEVSAELDKMLSED